MNNEKMRSLLKYVAIFVVIAVVIVNVVSVQVFDTNPSLKLSLNQDELSWSPDISFNYEANNVDRITFIVSYIDGHGVGINVLGSYVLNNNLNISNLELFNAFNKLIGRKTPDKGTISLAIDTDENIIDIYASSYNRKSEESTISMANIFSDISFNDYVFSNNESGRGSDVHNLNVYGQWNDITLAKGINSIDGSKIIVYLIYE